MSWQELEALEAQRGEALKAQAALEAEWVEALGALFSGPKGEDVLEILRRRTVDRPTWPDTVSDGWALALMSARREGENSLYRWIVGLVRKGQQAI